MLQAASDTAPRTESQPQRKLSSEESQKIRSDLEEFSKNEPSKYLGFVIDLIETTEKQHWQPSYKQIVTHLLAIQREEDYSKKAKEKSFKVLRALLRASPENFEQMLT